MSVNAEWEQLRDVLIHRPGVEVEYAMLAPGPFLFERPFNVARARQEHIRLEEILKENGINVRVMRSEFRNRSEGNEEFRKKLENKVLETVKFSGIDGSVKKEKEKFKNHLKFLDPENLLHFLTLEPSIDLDKEEDGEVDYPTIYSNLPLANLYFMRDQQAMANDTVIIGRMKKKQRMKEVEITQFFFNEFYGGENIFKVGGDGTFEGGDFIPAGNFALIGIGPRTNLDGAMQIISGAKLKFKEFAVVENPVYDFMESSKRSTMVNMHIDTYFNIADNGLAVTSTQLCKRANTTVYALDDDTPTVIQKTTLFDYLKEIGYDFIDLRISEQMSYSSNFLTIKPGRIIAVNTSEVLKKLLSGGHFDPQLLDRVQKDLNSNGNTMFPDSKAVKEYGLDVVRAELSELTGGYGGAHCMTASLRRN